MKNSIDEMKNTVNLTKDFYEYVDKGNVYYALSCLQEIHNKIEDYMFKIGFWLKSEDEDKKLDIDKVIKSFK
jgi:hypothetical protein